MVQMLVISVGRLATMQMIVVVRIFILKAKWPQGYKLLQKSKVDKVKLRVEEVVESNHKGKVPMFQIRGLTRTRV